MAKIKPCKAEMVKGVIFDLDGTIVDSIDALWRAFNAGVAAFKIEPVVKERLLDLMNQGIDLAEILGKIYPELGTASVSSTVGDIMAEIKRDYLARGAAEVRLRNGVQELFDLLRALLNAEWKPSQIRFPFLFVVGIPQGWACGM